MEELLRIFQKILQEKEEVILITVEKIKELINNPMQNNQQEAAVKIVDSFMGEMDEITTENFRILQDYKRKMGYIVDEEMGIDGLSYDELLNMQAGEVSNIYGLNSAYIKYILAVGKWETKKEIDKIMVSDLASIPLHSFRIFKDTNEKKFKKVADFLYWLAEELKIRREVEL